MDGWNVLKDVVKKKIKKEIVKKKLFLFFPSQHCISKTFTLDDFAPYILHPVSVFKINAGSRNSYYKCRERDGWWWMALLPDCPTYCNSSHETRISVHPHKITSANVND